jgi:hypothetical protein
MNTTTKTLIGAGILGLAIYYLYNNSSKKNATGSKLAGNPPKRKWESTGTHQNLPNGFGQVIPMTYISYGNGGIWVQGTYPNGQVFEQSWIQGMLGLGLVFTGN